MAYKSKSCKTKFVHLSLLGAFQWHFKHPHGPILLNRFFSFIKNTLKFNNPWFVSSNYRMWFMVKHSQRTSKIKFNSRFILVCSKFIFIWSFESSSCMSIGSNMAKLYKFVKFSTFLVSLNTTCTITCCKFNPVAKPTPTDSCLRCTPFEHDNPGNNFDISVFSTFQIHNSFTLWMSQKYMLKKSKILFQFLTKFLIFFYN